MEKTIRINKYIADSGFCSRREADRLVADERVTVNGVLAGTGTQVLPTDKVRIDGEIVRLPEKNAEEEPVFAVYRKKKEKPNRSQRTKVDYAARSSHRGTRGGVRNSKPVRFDSKSTRKRSPGSRKSEK